MTKPDNKTNAGYSGAILLFTNIAILISYFCNKSLRMKENRQICRFLLVFYTYFFAIPGLYGQKYIVPWANTFTEHGWDRVAAITSDTGNNIILVRVFDKSCDIGQSHYNSRNFHNYVPKKYASITISLSEIFILCKTESTILDLGNP